MSEKSITVQIEQQRDYLLQAHFGHGTPSITLDEPAPLGTGLGPSPVQMLASAVGACLTDSLLFALRKFKQAPEPIRTEVQAEVGRNAEGRQRVVRIDATLHLGVPATGLEHLDRVLGQFEAFCTVTQSVGQGIPVHIRVLDSEGTVLKDAP